MKEVYWEIKINNLRGPRQAKLRQKSGPRFVYFDLPIYFLHDGSGTYLEIGEFFACITVSYAGGTDS